MTTKCDGCDSVMDESFPTRMIIRFPNQSPPTIRNVCCFTCLSESTAKLEASLEKKKQ